eukprot:scaffold46837_cov63-Cyclotella_meneghiniana.AAC.1
MDPDLTTLDTRRGATTNTSSTFKQHHGHSTSCINQPPPTTSTITIPYYSILLIQSNLMFSHRPSVIRVNTGQQPGSIV